jgi:hypothetical protein
VTDGQGVEAERRGADLGRSREDLNRARIEILKMLSSGELMSKPLIFSLKEQGISDATARAAIWDLVDCRQVQFTQDWKLTSVETDRAAASVRPSFAAG